MTKRKDSSRDIDAISFGLIVKRLRLQRGWQVQQLARAVGINRVHMGVIERGSNSPTLQTFIAICFALGVDPPTVLGEVLKNRAQFQKPT